jgi:hypothetical protein
MFWPLVSGVGFVLAVGVVIVLARDRTARWEHEREATDQELRRRRAHQRAKATRSALVAASTTRRHHWDRLHGAGRSRGPGGAA